MSFAEFVSRTARRATAADIADALQLVRGTKTEAARHVSDEAGIALSTAYTWLRATPTSRVDRLRALVDDRVIAAVRFRRAEAIRVGAPGTGRTGVFYKNNPAKHEGNRPIPRITVTANVAAFLGDAANDLLRGDDEMAADSVSDAIICGYEDGLQDTLAIDDWHHVDIE